jgi:hypothetical protein
MIFPTFATCPIIRYLTSQPLDDLLSFDAHHDSDNSMQNSPVSNPQFRAGSKQSVDVLNCNSTTFLYLP